MSSVTADGTQIAGAVVFFGLYVGNSVTHKLGDKLDAIIRGYLIVNQASGQNFWRLIPIAIKAASAPARANP